MFRILTFLALASVAFASESRVKRYYGSGGGCVVTGIKLFINGIYDHDLSSSEQTEFQQYQTAFKTYQQQETAYEAARAKQQQSIWDKWGNQVGNWWNSIRHNNVSTTTQVPTATITPPTPPSRPSFCNDNVTTQYYFDGCVVQSNKIYIGQTYARDLTSDEVNQLNTFNQQTKAYQEQLNQRYRQQWGNIKVSLPMFRDTVNGSLSTTSAPATATTAALIPPTPPTFCSTIYNIIAPVYSNYGTYTYDYESNNVQAEAIPKFVQAEAIPKAAAVDLAPVNQ